MLTWPHFCSPGLRTMEGDAWELAKENCVPVRSGRNKAALSELQADPADTTAKLALQLKRKELWQEVCDYKGNDPLEPWQRFIKWTQEHKAGNKADLQKLYEQCTSALLKLPRYNDDIRFLRIWIQYADCLPDPNDVFLFLKDKGLGLQFALFHEAYATFFELRGNCSAADAVYLDGINRQAKPLERLRQKYLAFQNRMAQRIQRRIQEDGSTADPLATADGPVRASLAPLVPLPGAGAARGSLPTGTGSASALVLPPHLRAQAASSSRDGRPLAAGSSLLGVSRPAADVSSLAAAGMRQGTDLGLAGARPNGSLLPGSQPGQGSRGQGLLAGGTLFSAQPGAAEHAVSAGAAGRLVVAMDDEFRQGGQHAGAAPASYSLVPEGVQNLKELKPYAHIRKENTEKAGVWAGATLAQAQPMEGLAAPERLDICVDDEFQEDDPGPTHPALSSAPQPSFRQTVEASLAHSTAHPRPAPQQTAQSSSLGSSLPFQGSGALPKATGSSAAFKLLPGSGPGALQHQPAPAAAPRSGSLQPASVHQPLMPTAQCSSAGQPQVCMANHGSLLQGTAAISQARTQSVGSREALQQPQAAGNVSETMPAANPVSSSSGSSTHTAVRAQQHGSRALNGGTAAGDTAEQSYDEARAEAWRRSHPSASLGVQEGDDAFPWVPVNFSQPFAASACWHWPGPAHTLSRPLRPTALSSGAGAAEPDNDVKALPGKRRPLGAVGLPAAAVVDQQSSHGSSGRPLPPSSQPCSQIPQPACQSARDSACATAAAPPAQPQPSSRAWVRPEPTVTFSTRAAFDALNAMFGGDVGESCEAYHAQSGLPQDETGDIAILSNSSVAASLAAPLGVAHQGQSQEPAIRPAAKARRALAAVPLPPDLGSAHPGSHPTATESSRHRASQGQLEPQQQPQQHEQRSAPAMMQAEQAWQLAQGQAQPVPPVAKRPHYEPTVTLNTRLAFDALNDMWSDQPAPASSANGHQQQQEDEDEEDDRSHMTKMPSLPAAMKPIRPMDVCRLANSIKPMSTTAVRPQQHQPPASQPTRPSAMQLHEDTEFIAGPQPPASRPPHQQEGAADAENGASRPTASRRHRSSLGYPGLGLAMSGRCATADNEADNMLSSGHALSSACELSSMPGVVSSSTQGSGVHTGTRLSMAGGHPVAAGCQVQAGLSSGARGVAQAAPSLLMYEDTVCMGLAPRQTAAATAPPGRGAPGGGVQTGAGGAGSGVAMSMGLYEDTEFLPQQQARR
ncbi:hypothetical protein QJQ45_020470 [Haematococcus lacustris]|nr:hypothetical protein QJQ45_020470 [Haematococcus lacustris]